MIGVSALVGKRKETLGPAPLHDPRKRCESGRQASIKKLIRQWCVCLSRQELDFTDTNSGKRRNRFLLANLSVLFSRAKTTPKVGILRRAVGRKYDTGLAHMLQQPSTRDA